MKTRYTGRPAIVAWGLCAGLLLLGALTALSIGFFLLPFGLLVTALTIWRVRLWPEAGIGALTGAAGVCALVAFANLGSSPCDPAAALAGQGCGGLNPLPWLVAATALGLAGYTAYRHWSRERGADGLPSRGGAP